MTVERVAGASSNQIDVLDRVLDKGIVIDAWMRVSLVGIDLITLEARVVVAAIETYLRHWPALASTGWPRGEIPAWQPDPFAGKSVPWGGPSGAEERRHFLAASTVPTMTAHFRKDRTLESKTVQALIHLALAAHRAWPT